MSNRGATSSSAAVDRPGLVWRVTLALLRVLPERALSRAVGALARVPLPRPLRRPLLGAFARLARMRLDEAARPLREYRSFNALFTRRLRPGLRSWDKDPTALASPVDGVIGQVGTIADGQLVQAKGRFYTAASLLADPAQAAAFAGGQFLTIYLSPRHYHRIHTPTPGHVVSARHIAGRLLPVHDAAVRGVDELFARNERLVCTLVGPVGTLAVVAVGATNVGSISVAFDDAWAGGADTGVTNRSATAPLERHYENPPPVGRGDELMAFHLGSTVILLTPPGLVLARGIEQGLEVQVGRTLARRIAGE